MNPDDPLTVTRTVRLDASADELWRFLTDDAELSQWLAGSASIDVVPGGVGRFVDGDSVRRAVVHRVEPSHRLGFTWWDETHPAEASTVELLVEDTATDGQVQLTITERIVGAPPAGGGAGAGLHACSWIDVADAWDARLGALADQLSDRLTDRLVGRVSPLAG